MSTVYAMYYILSQVCICSGVITLFSLMREGTCLSHRADSTPWWHKAYTACIELMPDDLFTQQHILLCISANSQFQQEHKENIVCLCISRTGIKKCMI